MSLAVGGLKYNYGDILYIIDHLKYLFTVENFAFANINQNRIH